MTNNNQNPKFTLEMICQQKEEKLAEIRGMTVEEIHTTTMENGKRLYRI